MIEQIRRCNRSVSAEFLLAFDEEALGSYLRRLTALHGRRGKSSVWVREDGRGAATGRVCA